MGELAKRQGRALQGEPDDDASEDAASGSEPSAPAREVDEDEMRGAAPARAPALPGCGAGMMVELAARQAAAKRG